MKGFLGIDTSAYTTSVALVDQRGELVADKREVLKVELGKRGLRQSEALFAHIKNLPFLFGEMEPYWATYSLAAIAVSDRPRNVAGSYMPVFRAGETVARSIASVMGIPLFTFSHQEGHIMAGERGAGVNLPERYIAVHFSGGTSEVLLVRPGQSSYYDISILAATADLHAGQLVDRVGVKMGLPFPCGKFMEELAQELAPEKCGLRIPAAVKGDSFSFSGAEAQAFRWLDKGAPLAEVSRAVFLCIANTLEKVIREKAKILGVKDVLLVGGVMANFIIRERLKERLSHPSLSCRLHFAPPGLSSDNAAGTAWLGWMTWLKTTRKEV
ncbi:peptidase M22 [Syntrophothermus lipocalidus]|uniref:N(6)-L-threonylcarbamoyladenine synthase n=1 Tax=Syntrophothermus lipocalidus (strain DSM 12680 / TGB-C1) TaxID=643648 RepID=D7CKH7_SYNLT|nr:peptidase M22 [Syntrophothermus lipocalidus]ADI01212.1 peptidase M22 glycoprotease [Syntrophothermus lipocalidus DSM 12680]